MRPTASPAAVLARPTPTPAPGLLAAARRGLLRLAATDLPLTVVGLGMLVVLGGTLLGLVIDPRVITGAPAWLKPAKFAVSIAIYSLTLVWLLGFVQGHRRLVAVAAAVTAVGFVIEEAIIAGQVVRGTTSHFNAATPLDGALFSVMGATIAVVGTMTLLVAVVLMRQKMADRAFAWSLRLGLLVAVAGMGVAVLMTTQATPSQAAALAAHANLSSFGGHTVGLDDGGPGLPVVGWSTVAGDLRVPHFLGLHALQVLPLVGWLVGRRRWLASGERLTLVWAAGLGYLGLVGLLTWQAERGQSVVAPDGLTLAALGALGGVVLVAVAGVLAHAARRHRASGVERLAPRPTAG